MMISTHIIVIGGGPIGASVAYGLARSGASVALLDEGDLAFRAAYGNFGLVWFQGKGLGMERYVDWTLEATRKWPLLADHLEEYTGVAVHYSKPGGLSLCLGPRDFLDRKQRNEALARQSKGGRYDTEMVGREDLKRMLPGMTLGPAVAGASFCRHDGHVNPLFLIRALHGAFQKAGGRYYPGRRVTDIRYQGGCFSVLTEQGRFEAGKIVLAAGVGIPALADKLGVTVPVRPERGQLIVTEPVKPVLPYPTGDVRQTREGSFLLGVSNEKVGLDTSVTTDVLKRIARNAVDSFPGLASLGIRRCWAALRPLAPDRFPIYHHCRETPGAYIVTSHSGVTLASVYVDEIARWIGREIEPPDFAPFDLRRFDV